MLQLQAVKGIVYYCYLGAANQFNIVKGMQAADWPEHKAPLSENL